jgi:hypothetical protein
LHYLDRFAPGRVLLVIDLTEIEHLALYHAIATATSILDDASVAMLLAVLEAAFGPKKHASRLTNTSPITTRWVGTTRRF